MTERYRVTIGRPGGMSMTGVADDLELAMDIAHAAQEKGLWGIVESAAPDEEVTLTRPAEGGNGHVTGNQI